MIVKVKGVGVKLAGKWCFVNETAEINKEEYENNKEYVEVIQEDIKEPENSEGELNNNSNINTNTETDDFEEDKELETLKEKARKLGINVTHNMKKETIIKKIEETESKEPENSEGE